MDISVHKGPAGGDLEGGGLFYWGLLREDGRGLWKWSISLHGSSAWGNWREGSFTGEPEGLEMDISHNRGPFGEPGGEASLPMTLIDGKRWLWKQSSRLYGGPAGGMWTEGFVTGGCKRRHWKWAFLSIGAPLGDQRGDIVYRGH